MTGQVLNNPIEIIDADGIKRTIQLVGIIGDGGEAVSTPDGSLSTVITKNGIIDTNNSTDIPLVADDIFIGESTQIKDYGIIFSAKFRWQ